MEDREARSWLRARSEPRGLERNLGTLRERLWLIVACVLVATAAAAAYVVLVKRVYKAEADVLVTPVAASNADLVGLGLITATSDPTRDVLTASRMVTTYSVSSRVIAQLGLHESPDQVSGKISAAPVATSSVVAITASDSSAAGAAALANAFAEQLIVDRTVRLHAELGAVIAQLQKKVRGLAPEQQDVPGSLRERLSTLQVLGAGPDPTLSIASLAAAPTGPTSPRTALSIGAGVIGGLLLGLAGAFGLQALDPRLRREDQLRELLALPILARVPAQSSRRRPIVPSMLDPAGVEAYRTLRATLLATESAVRGSRAILVTGAAAGEGTTTTAINLAASLAQAGHSVILVEADLREPRIGAALRLAPNVGVASLLIERTPLADALVSDRSLPTHLRLLLADQSGPQVADRLSLPSARAIIDAAKALADFVIVDSPALTEVIDALQLATHADDVIVVTRVGRTKLGRLSELGELLAAHRVRPTGIVVVGVARAARRLPRVRRAAPPVVKPPLPVAEDADATPAT